MRTYVETIKGTMISVKEGIAEMRTEIGTMRTNTDSLDIQSSKQPTITSLALIATIAAAFAVVLLYGNYAESSTPPFFCSTTREVLKAWSA